MGVGEVVGGAALVGIATLFGLSWSADDDPDELTSPTTSIFVWDSTSTSTATTTTVAGGAPTLPDTVAPDSSVTPDSSSPPSSAPPETSAPPGTTSTTVASPAATLVQEERANIAIQVINGSGETGAASFITDILRLGGFEPGLPDDAAAPITTPQGIILHAEGAEAEAQTTAAALGYGPDQVQLAPVDDPNWQQFGAALQVLVIVGT